MSGQSQQSPPLVLRPSLLRYLQTFRATMLIFGILVVVLFLRGGPFGAIAALVLAALASAIVSVQFRRSQVTVTPTEIRSAGLMRTRRTPRSQIDSVVTAAMPRSHKASRRLPHVFVLDQDGRCAARLKGTLWLEEDMRLLIRRLGLTPRQLGTVSSAKEIAATYPDAVSVFERRPAVTGVLIALPFVALAVASVALSSSG